MKFKTNEKIILPSGKDFYVGTYCLDLNESSQLRFEELEFNPMSDNWCDYSGIYLDVKVNDSWKAITILDRLDYAKDEHDWIFDTLAAYVNYEGLHEVYATDKIKVA